MLGERHREVDDLSGVGSDQGALSSTTAEARRQAFAEQPLGEPVHAALAGRLGGAGPVGRAGRAAGSTPASRRVAMSLKASSSSRGLEQGAAQGRAVLADRVLEHVLQRAVAAQQLGRGLRADALGAGQAVGGVAAQGDEVGHQLGIDPIALVDLLRADLFGAFALPPVLT